MSSHQLTLYLVNVRERKVQSTFDRDLFFVGVVVAQRACYPVLRIGLSLPGAVSLVMTSRLNDLLPL